MIRLISFLTISLLLITCKQQTEAPQDCVTTSQYLDNSTQGDAFMGGIKMIDINTPKGDFKVWTKRIGNNPKIKVLLLHGGPGMTHEIYECFEGYFPQEGIEFYYYDQLGSYYSDQPKDKSLWDLPRFVEEVELRLNGIYEDLLAIEHDSLTCIFAADLGVNDSLSPMFVLELDFIFHILVVF